jgi:DNA-binding transcriptional ArsR family regulator
MSELSDVDGALLAALKAGEYRRRVVAQLQSAPQTPTELAAAEGMDLSHVSRALGELREHDAVTLLVPEETKKGRVYGLTDDGEAAAEVVLDG